jgi:integrase
MYYETRLTKKGKKRFVILEDYTDPLTGKKKRASVSYHLDTSRARKQAERDLQDKIDEIVGATKRRFDGKTFLTFAQLRDDWLETWQAGVKPTTIKREILVIRRLSEIIADDYLLENITPLLVKNALMTYAEKYDSSPSSLQHIKSTFNKIFDHGVLYDVIPFSPTKAIKLTASPEKRKAERERREAKFLEPFEIVAFLDELNKRRNKNYYDLALFLLFTGLRIGEAGALTLQDFDFNARTVEISKSLQSHDLRIDDFYLDSTKTINSERTVLLPEIAIQAVKRVVERNRQFDEYMELHPAKSYRHSDFIFRTEYGAPITSHNFREVLGRVETALKEHSKERYGFEWKKHVVPHSFRHMQITYLQSGDAGDVIALKEVMGRVGHVNPETTMVYTHRTKTEQEKSVRLLDNFAKSLGLVS